MTILNGSARAWFVGLVVTALGMTIVPGNARAEVDPGWHVITQNGKVVGEIYAERVYPSDVPTENWVLYSTYVFPGPTRAVSTVIVPQAVSRYSNTSDFLQRVKWGPGFRLMESRPSLSTSIPGR